MEASTIDPTVEQLIPQPSRARNTAFVVVAMAVLVAVALSPFTMKQSIGFSNGGSWMPLGPHPYVASTMWVTPDGWPQVNLESVSPVPGASVAGAWVVSGGSHSSDSEKRPEEFATAIDYAKFVLGVSDSTQLPASVDSGEGINLIILWKIEDCDLLNNSVFPEVTLKTILGTTKTETLSDSVSYSEVGLESPAFDIEGLHESGTCP